MTRDDLTDLWESIFQSREQLYGRDDPRTLSARTSWETQRFLAELNAARPETDENQAVL